MREVQASSFSFQSTTVPTTVCSLKVVINVFTQRLSVTVRLYLRGAGGEEGRIGHTYRNLNTTSRFSWVPLSVVSWMVYTTYYLLTYYYCIATVSQTKVLPWLINTPSSALGSER